MSLFLDVLLLVIIACTVIGGYKRGFIRSVMNFASALLSFFAAVYFTPYFSEYLKTNVFLSRISGGIAETLRSLLGIGTADRSTEQLFEDMPDALVNIAERFGVNMENFVSEYSSSSPATEETVKIMSDAIADPVASVISSAIAFILIFVAAGIVLKIVTSVLNAFFELPVLKQLNSFAGLIFGIFCAVFYAVVISSVIVSLVGALHSVDPSAFSQELIEKTTMVKMFSGVRLGMLLEVLA